MTRSAAINWNVRFGPLGVLSELCLAYGITPDTCVLSEKTDFKVDKALYKSNDLADFRMEGAGQRETGGSVCVKLLRLYSHSGRKLVAIKQVNEFPREFQAATYTPQRFYYESARWKRISHANLIPVLGVSDVSSPGRISFTVITPWVRDGDIVKYLQKHREANRLELVSIRSAYRRDSS